MEKTFAFGVDIGGTNTKIGLFDDAGTLLSFETFPTNKEITPEQFVEQISRSANTLAQAELNLSLGDPAFIGVGVGAPMANYFTGRIEHAPNLNWKDVELKNFFVKYFKTPAIIENDANLAAVGEARWGSGKGLTDFALLTLGTGVGSGLILNGHLFRGHNGMAGEAGHIIIPHEKQRRCSCGGMNHVESYLSAKGIKQTILEITGEAWSLEQLSEYYKNKNPKAISVIEAISDELVLGLVALSVILGPQAFIIGGGVAKIGNEFTNLVEKKLSEKVSLSLRAKVEIKIITASVSAEKGAVYGGAALVFHEKDL